MSTRRRDPGRTGRHDLPSSGEPGVAPPTPGSLPRPAMWPPGTEQAPFRGAQGDTDTPPSPTRRRVAFGAVGLMVLGLALVGLAVVRTSWLLLGAGLVVGAVGAVVAVKAGIMDDVSVSDSPSGGA